MEVRETATGTDVWRLRGLEEGQWSGCSWVEPSRFSAEGDPRSESLQGWGSGRGEHLP